LIYPAPSRLWRRKYCFFNRFVSAAKIIYSLHSG
jgi:hypothetical protein